MEQRYRIVGDYSGHEYYVPHDKSEEWYEWLDAAYELNLETPEWATYINGPFTFTNPRSE